MDHGPASIAPMFRICSRCGAEAGYLAGEIAVDGVLHWSVGGACAACGNADEGGGRDAAPEHVRAALIAAHGEVVLRAEPLPGNAGARALMSVRKLFGVPLAEARGRLRALAEDGERGTAVEAALLAARLGEGGFAVTLETCGPPAREERRVPGVPGRRWPANPAAQGQRVLVAAPVRAGRGRGRRVELVPGSLPEELREPLADYLAGGRILVISGSGGPDPLAQGPYELVRFGRVTDGTWTWDLAWEQWVRRRGCAPPGEFVRHVRARGFVPPPGPTG
ncbi:hypothetical protein [Streptomyces sp. NPDC026673]|uniref:hypothetical protein n=1 Tax=Streptomyces sp. NPDC026673 TaxID=3155724 RepID=UPI0033CC298C